MSSPLARTHKSLARRLMVYLHHAVSHSRRTRILGEMVSEALLALGHRGELSLVDIGCGDMRLASHIAQRMPRARITGVDLYPLPEELALAPGWRNYRQFDGRHLPFPDARFDVAMCLDVLHHVADAAGKTALLREAARCARHVVVKDHFRYGRYTGAMLRIMDLVGNRAYGVSTRCGYFTPESFRLLCQECGLEEEYTRIGIDIYAGTPFRLVIPPNVQFLSVLRRSA